MKAPAYYFGKVRELPVVTYTDGKLDTPARDSWDDTWWIEREEEMYGLMSRDAKGKTIRIVRAEEWRRAKDTTKVKVGKV